MNAKKAFTLAAIAALSSLVPAAAATRTWTGGGDGTSWYDPANWGGTVPTIADRATIGPGDDLVINLNTNGVVDVLDFYLADSKTRRVTINGEPGAALRTNKNSDSYWSYITCSSTGTLVLNVPVLNKTEDNKAWEVYNQKAGTVFFNTVMSNMSASATMSIAGGTNYFGTGSGFWSPNGNVTLSGGQYDVGFRNLHEFTGDAFILAKSFDLGAYVECGSADIVQDGDETRIETDADFYLGSTQVGYKFLGQHHRYYLNRGTLAIGGNLNVATTCAADFRQSGGTVTVGGNCTIYNATLGSDRVSGGQMVITDGSFMIAGKWADNNNPLYSLTLANCTFGIGQSSDINVPLMLSGTVTFDVAEGAALKLCRVSAAPGTKIIKTGLGSIIVKAVDGCELDLGDGELDLYLLSLGDQGASDFRLTGGTVRTDILTLADSASGGSRGSFAVENAAFYAGAVNVTGKNYAMAFSNCTFGVGADVMLDVAVSLAGTVTFDIPVGNSLALYGDIRMAEDVKIKVIGGGTLQLAHDLVWRGDVDVVEGTFRFTTGYTYENADGDETVRRIDIRTNGCFKVDNFGAEVTSPRDVYIEDGGYVSMGNRSLFPVRHLYTNGVKVVRGTCLNSTSGLLRDGTSNLAVPYIWTGAGDGISWTDKKNWEDEQTPAAGAQISPPAAASARWSYIDFSAATTVVQNASGGGVQTIGGIIFNPNSGPKTLVLKPGTTTVGNRNAIRFNCQQYMASCFVGPGRELIFDDISLWQEGSQDWGFHGSGTYRVRGQANLFFNNWSKPFCNRNIMPVAKVVFERLTNTAEIANQDMGFNAMRDYNRFSDVVIGEGTRFFIRDLIWGKAGFDDLPTYRQIAGSYFSPDRMFLTWVSANKWWLMAYLLEGGELDVRTALYLGSIYADSDDYPQYPGGEFRMTGGILRTPLIGCENNSNYFRLNGGDAYIGAGGLVKTKATRAKPAKYVFTENTAPCVQWGGTTIHADADFTCGLDVALTGVGGDAKLDTAGHDVTFTGEISGEGALVKSGDGALVLNGTVSGIALRVTGDIAVDSAASVHVREFYLNGVRKTGTVPCGDGVVVVDAAADPWLDGAADAETFTATCSGTKSLSSLSYSCAVSDAGRLTIAGTGSIAFTADAFIYVREGDTIVITVPVTLGGNLTVRGGGTVEFRNGATVSRATGVTSAKVYVTEGTACTVATEVNGKATGIEFLAVTDSGTRLSCLRLEDGGYLCQKTSPTTGTSTGIGGTLEIATGATFQFSDAVATFGGDVHRAETIRLCGGTLRLKGKLALPKYILGNAHFEIASGTIQVDASSYQILPDMPISLSGELTIAANGDANQVVSLNSGLTGAGTLRKSGTGGLLLACDAGIFSGYAVDAGTLLLCEPSAATVDPAALVTLASTAGLRLDYDGTATVRELDVDGKQMYKGLYGEGVVPPRNRVIPPISGCGFLQVLTGDPPGILILVK